jgi:peptidyl-tRNA hydrolase
MSVYQDLKACVNSFTSVQYFAALIYVLKNTEVSSGEIVSLLTAPIEERCKV